MHGEVMRPRGCVQLAVRVDDSKVTGMVVSCAMRALKAEGYRGESGNFVRGCAPSLTLTTCMTRLGVAVSRIVRCKTRLTRAGTES